MITRLKNFAILLSCLLGPGMSDGTYRNVYEEMMGKYQVRDAVIVDTRFNGGGDLAADLAMFFTGELRQ